MSLFDVAPSKRPLPQLGLSPHEKAPLFNRPDAGLVALQIMTEVASGKFSLRNKEFHELVRQLGFVSLWFFEKYILGYNGPYADLNDRLHLEMANFYQEEVMIPGSKTAGFIARSHLKTSIWDHGANTWELNRDPDLTIGLVSEVWDRSSFFMDHTRQTLQENEFFAWLYPEAKVTNPREVQGPFNSKGISMPNKTKNFAHPSIIPIGGGGATAGIHVGLLRVDDIIGDTLLNSDHAVSEEIRKLTNWLFTNMRTLVIDWDSSRVNVMGTRYAIEDTYEPIMTKTKKALGYWAELDYEVDPEGEWITYYRMALEQDEPIYPDKFSREKLRTLELNDPWTYWTQYQNNPRVGGVSEFAKHTLGKCHVDWDEKGGHVSWFDLESRTTKMEYFKDMDLVLACDPGASERKKSAKTSRSAGVVYARSKEGLRFVLRGFADYLGIMRVLDLLFDFRKVFPESRGTALEQQGPFKLLESVVRETENTKRAYLGVWPVSAIGDKDTRIRGKLQPLLDKGQLYVVVDFWEEVRRELIAFPGGSKKDILDAISIAETASAPPAEEFDEEEYDLSWILGEGEDQEKLGSTRNPVTGY